MTNQLPNGWLTIAVGEIADVVSGGTPTASDSSNFAESGTDIAWLTPADLSSYKRKNISHGARDITQKGYNSSSAKLMPKGSILFSSRAPIGYVAIAENEISTNQGFKSFIFYGDVSSDYSYYYFRNIKDIAESLSSGTTFKELSGSAAKKLPFILCSFAEQKEIAARLDDLLAQVDTLKTRLDSIPNILKHFRQSVLAAAVSGKLTEEWRGKNIEIKSEKFLDGDCVNSKEFYTDKPSTWKWVRFGGQVKLINGDRGKNYPNKSEYTPQGIPFINTGHIESDGSLSIDRMNYISRVKFSSLRGGKIQQDDLVYCLRGATMGKTAIVNPLKEGAIASSLVIVRPKNSILFKFVYFFLTSPQGKELILRFDNGSAQPNLSAQSLSLYPIALPPLEEQKEIVRRVEELFAFADQVEQQVKAAQQRVNHLTQAILAKAFRGELTAQWREQHPDLISGENSAAALLARIKAEKKK